MTDHLYSQELSISCAINFVPAYFIFWRNLWTIYYIFWL